MQLHNIKSHNKRSKKRVGRGGKRGTFSGGGSKGQKSRAGASVKPGFRGGDNRIWQAFPKSRGASKKPGNARPHRKHRFYQFRATKPLILNVGDLNIFHDGDTITPDVLAEKGILPKTHADVKLLGGGDLKKKITLKDMQVSKSAVEKIVQAGGSVTNN
ncbi:MAG: uL15 family ribosomal protein [Candidatus Yanofskybacteria bacterium]|nr:uL15 family ribosomal protein [Candidatus Yanofskybacteria bacterium]